MTKPPPTKSDAPPPPRDLEPALAAFERGDFRAAAAAAKALLAASPSPEVATAARALLGRMAPDPWAIRVGVAAAAVLALLTAVYVF